MVKLPAELTPEKMTDCFIRLAGERYPNPAKIKGYIRELGLEKYPISCQIIVIQQFRDAVRQVGNRLIDEQKRAKILDDALIPFLEELEDKQEALEEGLLEEEPRPKKKKVVRKKRKRRTEES